MILMTIVKTILIPVIGMLILLLIPFLSILGLIKIRREMRINKGIKRGIKSGVWLNEYKYIMSTKFQKKIDKMIYKHEKKKLKKQR